MSGTTGLTDEQRAEAAARAVRQVAATLRGRRRQGSEADTGPGG